MKLPKYPKVQGHWQENVELLQSQAYNEIAKSEAQLRVLKYLYFRLSWKNIAKKKKKAKWIPTNNGQIDVPMSVMMRDLNINSHETMTQAIKKLVTVGFIEITRYGSNKVTHNYKILVQPACKHKEERWRIYPHKSWEKEAPKRVSKLKKGEDTWKQNFKYKPKGIEYNGSKQSKEIDNDSVRSLMKQIDNSHIEPN